MDSDYVKLLGKVWNNQKVMDNSGIGHDQKNGFFLKKNDHSKNLPLWNGSHDKILHNTCVEKRFLHCKYIERKNVESELSLTYDGSSPKVLCMGA